jgi:8-oxo-dGTP pyrophosphatase MutT (NUDIX family)
VTGSAADAVRRIGIKLAALAQDRLTFATSEYDVDRYQQARRLAAELLSALSGRPADELTVELGRDSGYATPKIDVRGVIFDEQECVLLMREKADGRWSLPGGWADPGESPSVAVTREILEETGYRSSAVKLLSCWDRDLQNTRRRCLCTSTSCSSCAARKAPVSPLSRWKRWQWDGSAWTSSHRYPLAGSISGSWSGRLPTTAIRRCQQSLTRTARWLSRPRR